MTTGYSSTGRDWDTLIETKVTPTEANRLARICAYSSSEPEWGRFIRAVSPVVTLAARRISANWGDQSSNTVSEIVQEVFLKLCEDDRRILREFEDRGQDSFLKLLRMITASVGTDHFRKIRAEKRGGRSVAIQLDPHYPGHDLPDHSAAAAVEWPTLMGQLDKLLKKYPKVVSGRDRTLFWLYYRQGLTAEAISRIPSLGLTAKGVESALLRLTRLLREAVSSESARPAADKADQLNTTSEPNRKGFSPIVAIDSMKRQG